MRYNGRWIDLTGTIVETSPFPHFSGTGIIKHEGVTLLHKWLASYDCWDLTNTSFYTQFEFSMLDVVLPPNLNWVTSEETILHIQESFMNFFAISRIELIGITAHKLIDGHKIGIHNDFIDGEETHRLIIQLNPLWKDENGGYLLIFDGSDPASVKKIVRPIDNSYFGFEISKNSYHAVSRVNNYSRHTLVYTLKAF